MRSRPWPLALGLLALGCTDPPLARVYEVAPVGRRDIIVAAEAAGTIEASVTVEVKSKASGEILDIAVETGERVARGTLMVRIDQRQPRNSVALSRAELEVARARLANADAQKRRAEDLFGTQSIPETQLEQAQLDSANARADVVRAEVAVENARIELADTEILAPIEGTIIEKSVEVGQVISSPTQDVGGGTVLLRMADLTRVQVRALVDETDIGSIAPGLTARVEVNAYDDRPFEGKVLKVEPQAVTEQNVTMFPVLVQIENREGLLRPGMNCEVEIHIDRRENVLAIPNAALRTSRDLASAAIVLGLSEQEVRRQLEAADRAGSLGETYFVFVTRDGVPVPRYVRTGLTDLDYSEVLDGLAESDDVLVLPSASLFRSQQRMRHRIERVTGGGLPGMRSSRARPPRRSVQ